MNNSKDRIFEGIVNTIKADIVPGLTDAYARGQAVAIIDILNNIVPRLELARAPILERLEACGATVREIRALLPDAPRGAPLPDAAALKELSTSDDLVAEQEKLHGEIGRLIPFVFADARPDDDATRSARALLRAYMRDDVVYELSQINKPMFAEISKGKSASEDET